MKLFSPVKAKTGQAIGAATGGVKAAKEAIKKGWEQYPEEEGKAGEMMFGCVEARPKTCGYILRLERDLVNSYYWSGNFCQDYMFFVANWHPLISIVFCHPNHPWTKCMRFQMQLISVAITMVPSAVITANFYGNDFNVAVRTFLILVFVTLPDVVYGVMLYQLAIGKTRCCGQFLGKCWTAAQYCCMGYVVFFLAVSSGICYVILSSQSDDMTVGPMFEPILEGRLMSAVAWFPIWLFLPCQLGFLSLWYDEQKAAIKDAEKKAAAAEEGAVGDTASARSLPERV